MKKTVLALLVLALVVVAALVVWRESAHAPTHGGRFASAALTLETAKVREASLPLYLQAVGQAVSEHSVAIRPQVSGKLLKVYFTEGDHVKQGQLLFQIDPAPYEAALLGAKAAWESADANAKRMQTLLDKKYVTDQEYQDAKAAADKALADYQTAQINLGYTRISAPISGRTGLLSIKSGNLVTANDTTPLVTINQMQPIDVQFALPQQTLDKVRGYQRQQDGLAVLAMSEDGTQELASGKLVFLSNQVDGDSGTFTLKASFGNRGEVLWPGQFVSVKMELVQQQSLVMPAAALQTGQDGNYVYQVKDGKTVITKVTLLREQGRQALISAGLAAGDEVVARVPRNLRAGLPADTRLLPDTQDANQGSADVASEPAP